MGLKRQTVGLSVLLSCLILFFFHIESAEGSDEAAQKTVTVRASDIYDASELKEFYLGKHYRNAWSTTIEVPVLDMQTEAGGLTVIKRGGGKQTRSLRLQGGDGKQYVIRSIQKYPTVVVPEVLQRTFVADLVQDQISAGHPYAAFVIPPLAEAAGVYHTIPKLFWVPDTHLLGEHREDFAGTLVLFEERPDEDESDRDNFGNSKDVIGSARVYEKTIKDNDDEIDQKMWARARLFDMLIGDWDRHEDQWRWAEFDKEGKGNIYKPIPRDRDQVFFKFDDGFLPWFASRKFAVRMLRSFNYEIDDLEGLNFQARFLDRYLTSQLTEDDWAAIAEDMKESITDEVIESAIGQWPDAIYELDGEDIVSKLKARRDDLPEYARQYYLAMARYAEVVGSEKHERFYVQRLNDEQTHVSVYKINKEGEIKKEIYSRTFRTTETEEVRLYGVSGYNEFFVEGSVTKGPLVRIIGGDEDDTIVDRSQVKGAKKHSIIYDREEGNNLEVGREAKDRRADDHVEYFNEHAIYYNAFLGRPRSPLLLRGDLYYFTYTLPIVFFGYNVDDGFLIGGGFKHLKPGFRKLPYASSHTFTGSLAVGTGAFNFKYSGDYIDTLGRWDSYLDAFVFGPNNVQNYFGTGNETQLLTDDDNYNRVRINQVFLFPAVKQVYNERHTLRIGPQFQYSQVEQTSGRFVTDPTSGLTNKDFAPKYYLGAKLAYDYVRVEGRGISTRGIQLLTEASYNYQIQGESKQFGQLKGDASVYFSLPLNTTFATRLGGAVNMGEYEFYQENTIGGKTNLRGYRADRFSGRISAYNNNDLRIKLVRVRNYFIPTDVGLLGFFDVGRVWVDDEDSKVWHTGYGGGIWFSPLGLVAVTMSINFSVEDTLFDLSGGFQF
jgi:hypothetical protein